MTRLRRLFSLRPALVLVLLLTVPGFCILAAEPQQDATAAAPTAAGHVWLGADGNPLPFQSEAEILDFLRTAKVVVDKGIPTGITGPRKLTLEKDGVRANAVFRAVDEERMSQKFGSGQTEMFFRDSYIFEPAAYELSKLLGMDNIPPATLRTYNGHPGSIQLWVEQSMTETERIAKKIQAPDVIQWSKQTHVMNMFDQLVYNTDRNRGNILITPDWKVWLVDHTRAFRRIDMLLDDSKIRQCDRTIFEKLKALDEKTLHEKLDPYLRGVEIRTMLKRRDMIVKRLDKFISEKGESMVLFTLTFPPAAAEKKP